MRLLAKSPYPGRPDKTLLEHTREVMDAFGYLFGSPEYPTRLARAWGRFFRLSELSPFFRCGLAAAAFHDWGKANKGFMDALVQKGPQLIRHEHLSGLLLGLEEVRSWLAGRPGLDQDVILGAVISHHLKVNHETFAQKLADGNLLRLLNDAPDFRELLGLIASRLGLDASRLPAIRCLWSFGSKPQCFDLVPHRKKLQDRLRRFDQALEADEPRRRLLWAVRAGLIAADAVGSAVVRLDKGLGDWIAEAFDEENLCTAEGIWKEIIAPRVEELKQKKRWDPTRGVNGWSRFQEDCAGLPERALLLAPCGSGKTLAAWRWIDAQLARRPAARVIFLYPTRATATEGFRDYVSWAPETEAALVHGTAEYDLQGMFDNPPDPGVRDPRQAKAFEIESRLFALGLWTRRIFSATVDQFFAFLQYQYGPVCLLPLLSDAVVVVDEVHSFDRGMFSALKQFLQAFDVPVLCMTATLPETRREQLERDCRLRVYNERPEDLERIAGLPRYRISRTVAADVPSQIRSALEAGKRVLWVVNQVKRAQAAARQLAMTFPGSELFASPGIPLYCYHSRFKLENRKNRHREVVAAFQGRKQPALAVTTQVCEMSLDLDADLLVTEEAPITALIQRMGRCNRQPNPPPGRIGDVLIYSPEDAKPYTREQLEGVAGFVGHLAALGSVSQNDLERALEEYGPKIAEPEKACRFLESGPYAKSGEEMFRDIEEFTTPAVLDRDVPRFATLRRAKKPTEGLIVPVPLKFGRNRLPELPDYLAVAPAGQYHPAIGFCEELLP